MALEDSDVQKLSEELKDFTKELSKFNKGSKFGGDKLSTGASSSSSNSAEKISSNFDKSTQKIVNALGQLSAALTGNARNERQKEIYIDKFNKTIKKVTDEQEKAADRAARKADQLSRKDEILRERARGAEARAASKEAAKQAERAAEKAKADKEASEKFKESSEELYDSFRKSASNVTSFVRNVSNSGDSLSSAIDATSSIASGTATALGKVGTGAIAVAPALGKFGVAVAGVGAALTVASAVVGKMVPVVTEGAKLMVQQLQVGLESFNKLTDVGLVSSFEQLRDLSDKMGLTFQDVAAATSKYGTSLAAAGGTAEQGMEKFAKVAKQMELDDVGLKFRALGLSAAQTAEYQARYIAQETRYGLIKNRSDKSLADGTKNYVEQLTMLSRLTGESREALQQKEDSARSESQYAATLELLKGTPAYQEMVNTNMLVESRFDAKTAKGLRDSAGGVTITEEAIALSLKTGGESVRISDDLQKGLITSIEAANRLADAMRQQGMNSEAVLKQTQMVGDIGGPYQEMAKTFESLNKSNLDKTDADKILAKVKADQEAAKDPNTTTGAAARAQNAIYKLNVDIQQELTGPKGLTTVLGVTTKTLELFREALQQTVDFFNKQPMMSTIPQSSMPTHGSTSAGAATGNPSASTGTTKGNSNIREGGLRARAAEANAAREATKSGSQTSLKPTQDGGLIDPRLEGLNVKVGDVHRPGAKLDDRIPGLAKKIQTEIAGFERFTGFNDSHTREKGSKHPEGKAVDFTLGYHPTVEQGAEIVTQLKGIGFDYAQDEYNNRSSKANAPHIHAQVAKTGGVFKGPSTGYNVTLHEEEIVIPKNQGVSKQPLNTALFPEDNTHMKTLIALMERTNDKYDRMIELLSDSLDNSDKLVAATA